MQRSLVILFMAVTVSAACGKAEVDDALELVSTTFDDEAMIVKAAAGSDVAQLRLINLPMYGVDDQVWFGDRVDGYFVARVPLEELEPGPIAGKVLGRAASSQWVSKPFEAELPLHLRYRRAAVDDVPKEQRVLYTALKPVGGEEGALSGTLDDQLTLHVSLTGYPGVEVSLGDARAKFDESGRAHLEVSMEGVVGDMELAGLRSGPDLLNDGDAVLPSAEFTLRLSHGDKERVIPLRTSVEKLNTHWAMRLVSAYAEKTRLAEAPTDDGGALLAVIRSEGNWVTMTKGVGKLSRLSKIGVAAEHFVHVDCGTYVNEENAQRVQVGAEGVDLSVTTYRAGAKPRREVVASAGRQGCRYLYRVGSRRHVYPSEKSLARWLAR